MEKVLAKFDDYTLREVSLDRDAVQLTGWIARDPYHQHLKPPFFLGMIEAADGYLQPDPRPSCYALEDVNGEIFYIRIDRAARVNIQFAPWGNSLSSRSRVARGLLKGMAFLEVGLGRAGVAEWVFDTRSLTLKAMAKSRLGFEENQYDLVRPIPPMRTNGSEGKEGF